MTINMLFYALNRSGLIQTNEEQISKMWQFLLLYLLFVVSPYIIYTVYLIVREKIIISKGEVISGEILNVDGSYWGRRSNIRILVRYQYNNVYRETHLIVRKTSDKNIKIRVYKSKKGKILTSTLDYSDRVYDMLLISSILIGSLFIFYQIITSIIYS